jgi:Flp pilus assembly protein TadD
VHERQTVAVLRAVTLLRARHPSLHLVLKLHPSTTPDEEGRLRRLANEAGAAAPLFVRDRVPMVLAASDVLVTLPSTIAVEALIVGTPVIAPEFFYEGDAVRTVTADPDAIVAVLDRMLGGWRSSPEFARQRRDFLARYNGACDGRAAERVAAVVEDLVRRTHARRSPVAVPTLGARLGSARALVEAGRADDALALLEAGPTTADPPVLEAERLALRGEALSRLGRADDAERSFRSALAAGAGVRAVAGLGLTLIERGKHDEAEARLREALALDASCDWVWCGLGVLEALRGNGPAAVPLLERALALNPANGDARNALRIVAGAGDRQVRADAG